MSHYPTIKSSSSAPVEWTLSPTNPFAAMMRNNVVTSVSASVLGREFFARQIEASRISASNLGKEFFGYDHNAENLKNPPASPVDYSSKPSTLVHYTSKTAAGFTKEQASALGKQYFNHEFQIVDGKKTFTSSIPSSHARSLEFTTPNSRTSTMQPSNKRPLPSLPTIEELFVPNSSPNGDVFGHCFLAGAFSSPILETPLPRITSSGFPLPTIVVVEPDMGDDQGHIVYYDPFADPPSEGESIAAITTPGLTETSTSLSDEEWEGWRPHGEEKLWVEGFEILWKSEAKELERPIALPAVASVQFEDHGFMPAFDLSSSSSCARLVIVDHDCIEQEQSLPSRGKKVGRLTRLIKWLAH